MRDQEGRVPLEGPKRKLTTILCADCAGYSRMMRDDEEATFKTLHECRQLIERAVAAHEGRIFGSAGDSVVAEFASPVEAVRAGTEILDAIAEFGTSLPAERRMLFRIGINLGDVLLEGADLIGDGVNVASRLQALAPPGGICISGGVHEQVKNKLTLLWEDLGGQRVKNIADPVHAYRLRTDPHKVRRTVAERLGPSYLRRVAGLGALAIICIGLVGSASYLGWQMPSASQCGRASIAVLPFDNLSGDPAQDYFSDGTTEDIIAALGRFSDMSVIARGAVQKYKGKPPEPASLSRDLGVCYALEGSVRKTADRVLVSAQLVDTASGKVLWSDSYDGSLNDVFAVRNQITQDVAGKLAIKLQDIESKRAFKKPTDSLEAYDYLLRGREYYARGSREANSEARKLFEKAISIDPSYASAHAALGYTRLTAAELGWTEFRAEALQEAQDLAQKAIALDRDNAEAHRLLGEVYFKRAQFDLAISEDERAIALNPNDAASYDSRGAVLVYTGRPKEALASFEVARRLNPDDPSRLEPLGWAYYLEGRFEEAIAAWTSGTHRYPDLYVFHAGLAAAYAQLNRRNEAASAVNQLMRTWPFFESVAFSEQFQGDANRARIVDGLRKAGLR